jgi:hypothetical protein
LLPQLASTIKKKKSKKLSRSCQKKVQKTSKVFTKLTKIVKNCQKVVKICQKSCQKVQKVVKNFVTPGKNPNINNGAIVEKMQWCVEKNKKPMVQ